MAGIVARLTSGQIISQTDDHPRRTMAARTTNEGFWR
jgi:hypothetical protein